MYLINNWVDWTFECCCVLLWKVCNSTYPFLSHFVMENVFCNNNSQHQPAGIEITLHHLYRHHTKSIKTNFSLKFCTHQRVFNINCMFSLSFHISIYMFYTIYTNRVLWKQMRRVPYPPHFICTSPLKSIYTLYICCNGYVMVVGLDYLYNMQKQTLLSNWLLKTL